MTLREIDTEKIYLELKNMKQRRTSSPLSLKPQQRKNKIKLYFIGRYT